MNTLNSYTIYIPYFYFISIISVWFTLLNKNIGIGAYPILLLGIPFVWQVIRPSRYLNFILGISFICFSSYLIAIFISSHLHFISTPKILEELTFMGGLFIPANFIMALWIIRNSLKRIF